MRLNDKEKHEQPPLFGIADGVAVRLAEVSTKLYAAEHWVVQLSNTLPPHDDSSVVTLKSVAVPLPTNVDLVGFGCVCVTVELGLGGGSFWTHVK